MNRGIITTEFVLLSWSQSSGTCAEALSPRAMPRPQPSLRIPVTPTNRDCLRRLRAAESDAWEKSAPRPSSPMQLGKEVAPFSGAVLRLLVHSAAGAL